MHRRHDETFYVLSGAPTFTSGGDTTEVKPGMLVTAPPGTPHTFDNHGDENAVMLMTTTPDLYIGYFRELASQPSGPLDPKAVGEIMSRYATEVVTPHPNARDLPVKKSSPCGGYEVWRRGASALCRNHEVPDGGGLTAAERARREGVRLVRSRRAYSTPPTPTQVCQPVSAVTLATPQSRS